MYSFYCKNCGFSFSHKKKKKVAKISKKHKIKTRHPLNGMVLSSCPLVTMANGNRCRPGLKKILKSR